LILTDGVTPQGTKTNDVVEVLNGEDAWEFVKSYKSQINESFVRKTQFEVTKNTSCRIQGDYRDTQVGISGSTWNPPLAKDVPRLMKDFVREHRKQKRMLHPVELACWVHNKIAQIHPFTDGNGRTARLLMNWVLIRNKFPPVIIQAQNKEAYYRAIERADKGSHAEFTGFIARELLQLYTVLEQA
jgi:Fic family protein